MILSSLSVNLTMDMLWTFIIAHQISWRYSSLISQHHRFVDAAAERPAVSCAAAGRGQECTALPQASMEGVVMIYDETNAGGV
jgi:hypothetical protein